MGSENSCTNYSEFEKLGIRETSAQPSIVLLKQMLRGNLRLQVTHTI